MSRPPHEAFEEPLKVVCVDGEVVVVGPAHMHGAFTPQAAQLSADVLAAMARQAGDESPGEDQPET